MIAKPQTGGAVEKSMLKMLDVESGKSDSDKSPVFIVKQSSGRRFFQFIVLIVLVVLTFLFFTTYNLNITRREYSAIHKSAVVDQALARMKLVETTTDLQSHLEAEVQERDEAEQNHNEFKEEMKQEIEDSKSRIVEWFKNLEKEQHTELKKLDNILNEVIKDEVDKKMVKQAIKHAAENTSDRFNTAHQNVIDILVPVYSIFDKFMADSMDDVRAHGSAAESRLNEVKADLRQSELQAAQANSNLRNTVKDEGTKFSEPEMRTMVDNFLRSFHKAMGQHRSEELAVKEMSEKLTSSYDPHFANIDADTLQRLTQLQKGLEQGTVTAEQSAAPLKELIEGNKIPAPSNLDMSVTDYVAGLVQVANKVSRSKHHIEDTVKTLKKKRKTLLEILAVEKRFNKDEVKVPEFFAMIKQSVAEGETPAAWLVKSQGDAEGDKSWNERVETHQKVSQEVDKEKAEVAAKNKGGLTSFFKPKQEQATIPPTPPPVVKDSRHKQVMMDAETQDWLRSHYDMTKSGKMAPGEFYHEVVDKYNEGKISYDLMSKLTKQMAQFAPKPKGNPRDAVHRAAVPPGVQQYAQQRHQQQQQRPQQHPQYQQHQQHQQQHRNPMENYQQQLQQPNYRRG